MGLTPAPALRELVATQGDAARWYGGRPSAPTVFIPGNGSTAIPTPPGMISLPAPQDARGELHSNKTASLIDLGDGIACLEFRGKMNVLDDGAVTMLAEALAASFDAPLVLGALALGLAAVFGSMEAATTGISTERAALSLRAALPIAGRRWR